MIPEILITLFGSSAYDVIKRITKSAFGRNQAELEERVQVAIVNTINNFFENFGNNYGKESNSFLAREENWVIVAKYLRHDTPDLTKDQINPKGFKDSPHADNEALDFFINDVKREFKNDLFLNLLLGVKETLKTSKTIDKKLIHAITELNSDLIEAKKNKKNNNLKVGAMGGDLPPQNELKDGKLYVRNVTDRVKLTYMKRGNKVYSEAFMGDGAVMYYEIDENAKINIIQPPYPVSIYIPPEFLIKKEVVKDKGGNNKLIFHGKWGLRIECEEVSKNQFGNPSFFNANITISSKDKRMIVKPNNIN